MSPSGFLTVSDDQPLGPRIILTTLSIGMSVRRQAASCATAMTIARLQAALLAGAARHQLAHHDVVIRSRALRRCLQRAADRDVEVGFSAGARYCVCGS
jgi:hypothetical protein